MSLTRSQIIAFKMQEIADLKATESEWKSAQALSLEDGYTIPEYESRPKKRPQGSNPSDGN